jgi:1-acyl-sn-glycerol-3-phosphate acyltransferase
MLKLRDALRSILLIIWMMATVAPWGIMMLVMSIAVRGKPLFWVAAGWLKIALFGARWICGIRYRIRGWEHVMAAHDAGQRVILCSKHQSTWETFFYPTVMPRALSYVFKRELIYVPFFGWAMAQLDMVHIDRSKGALAWERVANQGRKFMDNGMWVIMFPEGTRIRRGKAGNYKNGAARLAVATGVPIIPIAVNSATCWPKGTFIKRPGVIDVSIGRPISPEGHTPETMITAVQAWIEAEMHRIDPSAYELPADAEHS